MQYLQRSTKQEVLHLFHIIWREAISREFMNATVIHLFKRKGNPQVCDNPCKNPTELTEWTPWTVRASTRKSMWIKKGQRNNWHDFRSKTASKEMPGIECGPQHDLCRPYQSIWHSQSCGTLENYGKVWLSCQIHSDGMLARVQNDGEFSDPFPVTNGVKLGCVKSFNTVQHDVFCHANRCFPECWQWYTY